VGSTPHLSGALFNSLAHVNIVHVPYKGNAPAITDLLAGQVQLAFLGIPPVRPHIQSGKLRALAVTSAKRSEAMPKVPTLAEAGVPGYELSPWYGILAPAGTPAAIVKKLNAEIEKLLHTPEMTARLEAVGAQAEGSTPEEYAARLKADIAKWRGVIRAAHIGKE
jgi:tripartite-type tricarboxylate transporter receptor subunit TctC